MWYPVINENIGKQKKGGLRVDYFVTAFESMRALTPLAVLLRCLVAALMGGIIGMERGMKNRPAGLRTHMLVCLGASVVMMTNQFIYQCYGVGDPVRMGAQVISGIGFLGAGTIIVTRHNQIKGLTTAAGLWASACVGLGIGIGLYEVAILGSLLMFLVLTALHELDYRMRRNTRVVEVYVELNKKTTLGDFLRNMREMDIETSNIQLEHDEITGNTLAFVVTLTGHKPHSHNNTLQMVREMKGVTYVEEL